MNYKGTFISCVAALLSLNVYALSLDNNKSTSHFNFHFSQIDDCTMSSVAEELERFYTEISEEFSFFSNHAFDINIYPDIRSFHKALGYHQAPSWLVAEATSSTIDVISPTNPGPSHSKDSIKKIMKLNVVKVILYNKFGQNNIPYWLAYGVGAVKAKYGNNTFPLTYIPSLKELETSNYKKFSEIKGFQASFAFVDFIQKNFGWNVVIDLLSNYPSQKETLYQSWKNSLSSTYAK